MADTDTDSDKQECILVGCVPPPCCPYIPACTAPGGWGGYLVQKGRCTWSRGCTMSRGCTWSQGVYLVWGVYLVRGVVPARGGPAQVLPPPMNRMTDRCKNITLPQTLFAGGKNGFNYNMQNCSDWMTQTPTQMQMGCKPIFLVSVSVNTP